MRLYHVQFDGQSYYVEATSFAVAVECWKQHVSDLWGDDYTDDEPESVHCVHDEPVIRREAISAGKASGGGADAR